MRHLIPALALLLLFFNSCNKKDTPPAADPCIGFNYVVDYFKTASIGTSNNGTITINFPVGDTVSYKLNIGTYQTANYFQNLSPGDYVLTIKNNKGCTDTAQINIPNYGPKYAPCSPTHPGILRTMPSQRTVNGGKNFDTDASVVASWDRIKARAVDGIPTFMPEAPNSPLTAPDKQKIVDWVNAGHRQTD